MTLKLRHFTRRPEATGSARRLPSAKPAPTPCSGDGERALLSTSHGRIRHVFLVATRRMPGFDEGMLQRLLNLSGGFDRISLAVHDGEAEGFRALAESLGLGAKTEIIEAPAGAALWPWAQDRVAVFHNDAGVQVMECADGDDYTGAAAAQALGGAGRAGLDLPQPGGNVLVDGKTCFVGADFGENRIDTRRAIEVIACQPLQRRGPTRFEMTPGDLSWREDIDRSIASDGSRQPVFHLDMFMTLAGTTPEGMPRILLGDPVWASTLIGLPLPEGFPIKAFDQIDYGLRLRGYEVLRNPLPFIYFDDPDARLREWFYASANNCWVECIEDHVGCRVFLPEYGFGAWAALKACDDANAAIWEGLGFEVIRGGDFLPLADQLGSLNCVTRILERA
ncbi:hypothetical protein [Dongia sp. agr-C8]